MNTLSDNHVGLSWIRKRNMVGTEAEAVQHDETPFLFRGGELALDLVNTEAMKRGKRCDLLTTPQDVVSWWQVASQHHLQWKYDVQGERGNDAVIHDAALLNTLKSLRAALRGIFGALADGVSPHQENIAVLNEALQTGRWFVDLTAERELQTFYRTTEGANSPIVLACALSALHLIREGDRKRLHRCESDRCILFFYDTTRSATRRWCSVGCMDRARSLQRYHQARQEASS
jgi:predicted RNA-binding Zn ribbon-like protein